MVKRRWRHLGRRVAERGRLLTKRLSTFAPSGGQPTICPCKFLLEPLVAIGTTLRSGVTGQLREKTDERLKAPVRAIAIAMALSATVGTVALMVAMALLALKHRARLSIFCV